MDTVTNGAGTETEEVLFDPRGLVELDDTVPNVAEIDGESAQFDAKRQSLTIQFHDRGALWLDADPARIEQILGNLLTNAMRYSTDRTATVS